MSARDQKEGRGRLTYYPGTPLQEVYDGEWRRDVREGLGEYRYCDGSMYRGQWKGGIRHGRGLFRYQDGRQYDGDFKKDQMHGWGVSIDKDGAKYEGEFVKGERHCKGTLWYRGKKYVGRFRRGEKHGRGAVTYPDGNTFKGVWEANHRVGAGNFILHSAGPGADPALKEGLGARMKLKVFGY